MSRRLAKKIKLNSDEPPIISIEEEEAEKEPELCGYEMESGARSVGSAEPPIVSTSP